MIHRKLVALGAADAVSGAGRVDQTWIQSAQGLMAEAQPFHHAGGEVLEHHVGLLDQLLEELATAHLFEIQGDALFVRVQQRKRHGGFFTAGSSQSLAGRRLHLDHLGARFAEQKACVRPLIDLTQVEYTNAFQRTSNSHMAFIRPQITTMRIAAPTWQAASARLHPPRTA